MTRMVLAFAGGVIGAAWIGAGAGLAPWAALALVLAALAARASWGRAALCLVLGAAHFELAMQRHLDRRDALLARPAPLVAAGRVQGLPDCTERGCAFGFRLDGAGARLRLYWNSPTVALEAGRRLRLELELQPHWALRNPGGFDRETWALARGVHAAGRVRAALDPDPPAGMAAAAGLDRLRQRLGTMLAERLGGAAATPLLAALAIGDRRGLDERHRAVLARTGTAHLLAISGLHIGLVAGLGFFAARLGYRLLPATGVTRQGLAAAVALAAALGYAALAGFALPTVRALIMLAIPLGALLLRRGVAADQALTAALGAILLVDPFAALEAGFWLSFGAVTLLVWVTRGYSARGRIGRLLRPQWAIFLGLGPLLAAAGLPVSLLAPAVNLVAIPWVSVLVLPPLLVGLVGLLVWPPLADLPLRLSAVLLQWLWQLLEPLAAMPLTRLEPAAAGLPLALALAGVVLALGPRGWPAKSAGLLLLGPLLAPLARAPEPGVAWVHVLDVGQGAATVVQTREHALLFDAGPGWSSGWNAGRAVVRPFLRRRAIKHLDLVVISHADADHAGGLPGVRPLPSGAELLGSSPDGRWPRCFAGDTWNRDGVHFELLHPSPWLPYLGNDSSCVLMVRARGARYLLTGDIGHAVERRLARASIAADAMSVPHHGSRSSSSAEFLAAVGPRLAVVQVGQGNRFDMPHPETARRYAARGIALLSTAECGYLRLELGPDREPRLVHAERAAGGRPWHQPGLCPGAQTRR